MRPTRQPQESTNTAQEAYKTPTVVSIRLLRWPQEITRWPEDVSKTVQEVPKKAQVASRWPKLAQDNSKASKTLQRSQRHPKGSRWPKTAQDENVSHVTTRPFLILLLLSD